ncbi:unnamed protein product [Lampetra planeri]
MERWIQFVCGCCVDRSMMRGGVGLGRLASISGLSTAGGDDDNDDAHLCRHKINSCEPNADARVKPRQVATRAKCGRWKLLVERKGVGRGSSCRNKTFVGQPGSVGLVLQLRYAVHLVL